MRVTPIAVLFLLALSGPASQLALAEQGPPYVVVAETEMLGRVLAWQPVEGAYLYTVYRGFSLDKLERVASTDEPFYVDWFAPRGQTLYYAVSAHTRSGESEPTVVSAGDGACIAMATNGDFAVYLDRCKPEWL